MSALAYLGGLVLEDGRRWIDAAAPWQVEDAATVLSLDRGAPRMHLHTRPRGGSKTTDEAGIGIAALLDQFPERSNGYVFAVDQEQAGLWLDAASGFVVRSGLGSLLEVQTRRIVHRESGATVHVLAADAASAFGLRPFFLWCDEFAQWGSGAMARRLWEAIVSSVPKVPDCRLAVMTTAGDPSHWSAKVLAAAKASSSWRVSEVEGPLPWISQAALDEQRRLLTEAQFARLHLNRWTAPEDRLTSIEDVIACVTPGAGPLDPERGARYVIGLDIGVRNDRTVAAVCSLVEHEGAVLVALDRIQVWAPSKEHELDFAVVEEWLIESSRAYNGAEIVFDPYSAIHLTQRLRAARINCSEHTFTQTSISRLALTLYRLLREHPLDLPDDRALIDELAAVQLRETAPGVVRIDHDPGRHDDRAIALALACQHLLSESPRRLLRYGGSV